MIDLHLFALNCNESFRIVVEKKEKRAKLFCLTLSISLFYLECFRINLLGPPAVISNSYGMPIVIISVLRIILRIVICWTYVTDTVSL